MRILVRPFYTDFLGNKLFQSEHDFGDRWMEPFARWRALAESRGHEIATWDMRPLESADVIVSLDLPTTRAELLAAKSKAPRAKFMLVLFESPLSRPHA